MIFGCKMGLQNGSGSPINLTSKDRLVAGSSKPDFKPTDTGK